jgi:hypothetical protein
MAKKPMKAAGVSGVGGNDRRTKRSPLAPTSANAAPSGGFDDASSRVVKGTLRQKYGAGVGGSDAALGMKAEPTRTSTTASSAQFRVTTKLPGPVDPSAQKTLANGRTLPSVMGTKQRANFDVETGSLY